ncbi:hypothetical protein PI124_g5787 [Phytophthora idaei]|nr:hypothetical protein PI125_g5289 [Phytophthora idaei]KAG3249542.1 hypothetical protein PI124_g5787 [Phytophthora idaei]
MLNDAWACFGVKINCFDTLKPPTKRPKKDADPKSSVSAPLAVGHANVATDLSLSSPPVPTRACTPSPAPTSASKRHQQLHQLPRCLRRLARHLCGECSLCRRQRNSHEQTSTAGATDEGVFLESGDEEDFCIEDDVSDDETCDDKNVADENDEESDSDSEAKVATPDPILEEPNTDEADLLHLLCASASSHDMSKADLRLHTLKGWDAHMEDSSKYCLHDKILQLIMLSCLLQVEMSTYYH